MANKLSPEDEFESDYVAKFQQLAARRGIIVKYDRDRAAIDIGLHLSVCREMTDIRVWFQFKGIHKETLSLGEFEQSEAVRIDLSIEHLRMWYRSPEPVYLVVYIESADCFLAIDTGSLIGNRWGDEIFQATTFKPSQKEVRVQVPTTSRLDDALFDQMLNHSSMRTDGPAYRGNPLGHTYDIRSRTPLIMDPSLYREVVDSILAEHRFRLEASLDTSGLFVGTQDQATLVIGKLYEPYEWVMQLTADLLGDEDGYRQDGEPFRVQGRCAVLFHTHVVSRPHIPSLRLLADRLRQLGIKRLLVFVNHHQWGYNDLPYNCFPEYLQGFQNTGVDCVPQHLEDLGRNILGASNVYNKYKDKIEWWGLSHLKRKHGELFTLKPDGTIEKRED